MTEDLEDRKSSLSPTEACNGGEGTPLPVEEQPEEMEPFWSLSPRALVAGFLVLIGVLVFHPSLVNLFVWSEESPIPMNYVETFHLWSRKHPVVPQSIVAGSQSSLITAHFYPRHTYVIVHGFLGTGTDDWIISLKNALLHREDCNVISVSWKSGTVTAGYYVIQARVTQVGEDISNMLKYLEEVVGLTPDLLHLIGHSLGAHVVGFVGKHFNGSLSRITGLDPAGLMYHQAAPADRLDKSDAGFVDVIHTHGCTTVLNSWNDCYGIDENIGDADFWPNGGEKQPACQEGGDGDKLVRAGSDCNHGMAYVLYTESILYPTSTTRFLARPCLEWKLFNNGICPCYHPGQPVQYMGYNVNPFVSGVFYLNTSNTAPYALLDYDCPPGSFSVVQLIGLILLSILMLIMMLVVVAVIVQQYYGIPIFTRLRSALGIEGVTFHGLPESMSSQLLAENHKVDT